MCSAGIIATSKGGMGRFSDEETGAQRHPHPNQPCWTPRNKLLTTEVLVQVDDFLESQFRLVHDEAEDLGAHVPSLQGDVHTAAHVVGVSAAVDAGLGVWQRVVVLQPGHRDVLCVKPGGRVLQLDACARLRPLKGALQGVRVAAPACKETPPP